MSRLPRLYRARAQQVALGLACMSQVVLGFLPLFGGPSYESALGAGALLPSIAAVATAIEVARRRPQPFEALARGAASGLMVACVALLVTLIHGARVGFCDPWPDIAFWLLAPMPG